jgi:hypothetical protein
MSHPKGKRRHFVPLSSQEDVTVIGHPEAGGSSAADVQRGLSADTMPSPKSLDASLGLNPADEHSRLHRGLSTRQVQMIAIAGEGTSSTAAKVYPNGANHSWANRHHWNGTIFGYIEVVGPRRPRKHAYCLFYRRLHRVCHTPVTRRDGHPISRRWYV